MSDTSQHFYRGLKTFTGTGLTGVGKCAVSYECQSANPLSRRADRGRHFANRHSGVGRNPGAGASFDKLRTNDLLVCLPLSAGTGRVTKTAYWAFAELYLFMVVLVGFLAFFFIPNPSVLRDLGIWFGFKAFMIAFLGIWWLTITMMPMTIRRLHDVGYSGTHYLRAWSLIGILGLVEILLQESQSAPNQYGPVPNSPSGHSRWSRVETRQHRSQYQERQAQPTERENPVGLLLPGPVHVQWNRTGNQNGILVLCAALPRDRVHHLVSAHPGRRGRHHPDLHGLLHLARRHDGPHDR